MTIKEIETMSGLPRANIRYYESEGLISPKRAENGYREYSQTDVDVLLRVKLLRALGLRIDTIKSLAEGKLTLEAALDARRAFCGTDTAPVSRFNSIIRTYSCWKAEQAEQLLEWEDSSELRAAPWKAWRGAAWAAAVLALLAATVLAGLKTCQPTYTGDLTVRQFADNYDYIHGTEGFLSRELYDDGTWAPTTQLGFQVIHHTKNVPNLSYTTKDGSLIGISLHMGAEACTGPVYGLPFRELYLTMLAFDGARSAASADEALAAVARQLLDEPLQELHTQAAGYQIDYSLTTTGFTGLAEDGSLELLRNTTGSYTLSFDMRKLDG